MAWKALTLSHLYPSTAYPGLGPFVRDQVVALASRGQITVVAPLVARSQAERRLVRAVPLVSEDEGLRVVRRPRFNVHVPAGGRFIGPWMWATRLKPVLHQESGRLGGANLIHAHFALPDGFAAAHFALREKLPLVLTVWGSDILVHGEQPISRSFVASTLRHASAVIAASDHLAERATALGADGSRVHVMVGGVPYQPPVPRDAARAAACIPDAEKLIVWVGGLVRVKQPLDAVAAFAELAMPDARLVMIGDGPLRKEVAQAAQRAGLADRVHLLGRLERGDVWRWQCAADLLVTSSRSEGMGFAVLEALGAGTPVACYPLPAVKAEVKMVAGGVVADSATTSALAAAMRAALLVPWDRDGLARRSRIQFSLGRVADAIEGIYAATLTSGARARADQKSQPS